MTNRADRGWPTLPSNQLRGRWPTQARFWQKSGAKTRGLETVKKSTEAIALLRNRRRSVHWGETGDRRNLGTDETWGQTKPGDRRDVPRFARKEKWGCPVRRGLAHVVFLTNDRGRGCPTRRGVRRVGTTDLDICGSDLIIGGWPMWVFLINDHGRGCPTRRGVRRVGTSDLDICRSNLIIAPLHAPKRFSTAAL